MSEEAVLDYSKMDYKAAWESMHEMVLDAAWDSKSRTFEACSLLETMACMVEKHGGPSFDEQVYGKQAPEVK